MSSVFRALHLVGLQTIPYLVFAVLQTPSTKQKEDSTLTIHIMIVHLISTIIEPIFLACLDRYFEMFFQCLISGPEGIAPLCLSVESTGTYMM